MSPLIGVLLLIGVTVALATVVAIGVSTWSLESTPTTAAFELTVAGERSAITIEHVAGDAIDVTDLSITVTVNEDPLTKQPPVPFVGAEGFAGAPTGPFNAESEPTWTTGERAGFVVAETNQPHLASGDSVTVTLAVDGWRVASLEATAT